MQFWGILVLCLPCNVKVVASIPCGFGRYCIFYLHINFSYHLAWTPATMPKLFFFFNGMCNAFILKHFKSQLENRREQLYLHDQWIGQLQAVCKETGSAEMGMGGCSDLILEQRGLMPASKSWSLQNLQLSVWVWLSAFSTVLLHIARLLQYPSKVLEPVACTVLSLAKLTKFRGMQVHPTLQLFVKRGMAG